MVSQLAVVVGRASLSGNELLLDDSSGMAMLDRLDPDQRAKVLMSLLAILLIGMMLIVWVLISGRRLRRNARKKLHPTNPRQDAAFQKPLVTAEPERADDNEA